MKAARFGLIGAILAVLAFPAMAQTTQATPAKPTPALTTTGPAAGARPTASAKPAMIDINSASADDLDALPGVGKSRAAAIIKNRPYKGKDDLLNRKVIPANVYNGIKDKIIAKQG